MRGSINPSKRFAVILRYYVTGDAQSTISVSYRIFSLKVYRILTEKNNEVWSVLMRKSFVNIPKTEN